MPRCPSSPLQVAFLSRETQGWGEHLQLRFPELSGILEAPPRSSLSRSCGGAGREPLLHATVRRSNQLWSACVKTYGHLCFHTIPIQARTAQFHCAADHVVRAEFNSLEICSARPPLELPVCTGTRRSLGAQFFCAEEFPGYRTRLHLGPAGLVKAAPSERRPCSASGTSPLRRCGWGQAAAGWVVAQDLRVNSRSRR